MIDLYYWPTPNGWKVSIFLEEVGLEYVVKPVNIGKGEQFSDEFLAISPNNKIPAIVDSDGPDGKPIAIFESGAILIYLADKVGRFLPSEERPRMEVLSWLMFQVGHIGPMLGQVHHFSNYAPEKIPYAIDRYNNEAKRLYGVLDRRLTDREYLGGEYSIADMATFPWIVPYKRHGIDWADYPNARRWFEQLKERPAVQRGLEVGKDLRAPEGQQMNEETRKNLFGATQYQRR